MPTHPDPELAVPYEPPHTFHIPVMGTGFTIDTPLKVARWGIASVVSLVDDTLIEQMREFHTKRIGECFIPIDGGEWDARARRITAYLDLLAKLVMRQVNELRNDSFASGSKLSQYYEMLPDCPPRRDYERLKVAPAEEARALEEVLRQQIRPGRIEANIMTKLDRNRTDSTHPEMSDALAALRGFARSSLTGALVLSAGINTRLFAYMGTFPDFFPDADGLFRKQIVLKVSDFRSAEVQSRFLAKHGLWVSEFRVESGLNCGGHAFPTQGLLLGPILEEFKSRLESFRMRQFDICAKSWSGSERGVRFETPPPIRLSVQGGIGTFKEDWMLRHAYGVQGTGWGTPFLLVPEATNVDEELLQKLSNAEQRDVKLSNSSPLGLPYWNLVTSSSEAQRQDRIEAKRPGSRCPKGFLAFNQEFGTPLCTASQGYQSRKLKALNISSQSPAIMEEMKRRILEKACICHELSGSARNKYGIDERQPAAICPGPNIAFFTRPYSLKEIVDHIYGRISLFDDDRRPHMFLNELQLYMDYLASELKSVALGLSSHTREYLTGFRENLLSGIEYYRCFAERNRELVPDEFLEGLSNLCGQLLRGSYPENVASSR
ncbi:MAG: hypothetical protein M5U26_12860 [Planctomycetota bacterium]|nr:hypothetical protein [Planctomycetota bacterium]